MPSSTVPNEKPPSDDTATRTPRRGAMLAALWCTLLLAAFATLAWLSVIRESATFDEPMQFIESWANTWLGDYRISPADPALWSYWAALPLGKSSIKADFSSPSWRQSLQTMTSQYTFALDTLYRTHG